MITRGDILNKAGLSDNLLLPQANDVNQRDRTATVVRRIFYFRSTETTGSCQKRKSVVEDRELNLVSSDTRLTQPTSKKHQMYKITVERLSME